jgi:hypothetical protein
LQKLVAPEHVVFASAPAERERRRVLDEEERRWTRASHQGIARTKLQIERIVEPEPAEETRVQALAGGAFGAGALGPRTIGNHRTKHGLTARSC